MKCSDSLNAFNATFNCSETLRSSCRMLFFSVCLCTVLNTDFDPEWITDQLIAQASDAV